MRKFILISIVIKSISMTSQSWGRKDMQKCSYEPGDIDQIHTSCKTKSEAWTVATKICICKLL
jgi:hypothetical protein